ncbi:MAG: transcriptional regulator [Chloroflexota bacterium]
MPGLSFITNHGLVLLAIAKRRRSTAREIGDAVGITERATHRIIGDLGLAGYITKTRVGRHNEYQIHLDMPLRDEAGTAAVGELLLVLGWKPRRPPRPRRPSASKKESVPGRRLI